jgi:hypothetical protein
VNGYRSYRVVNQWLARELLCRLKADGVLITLEKTEQAVGSQTGSSKDRTIAGRDDQRVPP